MKITRLILVPIVIFLTLGVLRANNWEILHDEGVTFDQAIGEVNLPGSTNDAKSMSEIASILNNSSSYGLADVTVALEDRGMHPPAYYYLIHVWTKVFGTRPVALRIPGIIFGLISLPGIWLVAGLITKRQWAGFWAAVLLSVSIVFIDYTLYLRPYGLVLNITIWSTWAALKLAGREDKQKDLAHWSLFTGLSILGIYTIYHYAFTLAWQFSYIFFVRCIPRKLQKMALIKLLSAALLIILSYIPWITTLKHHLTITKGNFYFKSLIPLENWPNNLMYLFESFIFGYHTEVSQVVRCGLTMLSVITAGFFIKATLAFLHENRAGACFWLSTIVLPLSIIAADYWHGTHTFFILRTSIMLLPLFMLGIVTSVFAAQSFFLKALLSALWISVLLFTSAANISSTWANDTDRQVIVNFVLQNDRPEHVIVFNNFERGYLVPVLVSLRDKGVEKSRVAVVGRNELSNIIYKFSQKPSVHCISLINLDIKYDRDVIWTSAELEKAGEIIKNAGKKYKTFKVTGRYI